MTEQFAPRGEQPDRWADEVYQAPAVPISSVPSAAPDYAHLRDTDPIVVPPIELRQVPDPTAYVPDPVFEEGPSIEVPEPVPSAPEAPITVVPGDVAVASVEPVEMIGDVPVAVPVTDHAEEPSAPVALIEGVPTDLPSAPIEAPDVPAAAPEKTPWWTLFLGGR